MKSHKNDKRRVTAAERVYALRFWVALLPSERLAIKRAIQSHANATLVRYKKKHRRAKVR